MSRSPERSSRPAPALGASRPGRWRGRRLARRSRLPDLLLALDLETTGVDPQAAEILAIGCVPIVAGAVRPGRRWSTLVRPVHRSASEGIAAHHLRPSELVDAPPLAEVLPQLLERIAEVDALVVHHAALDIPVLVRATAATGRRWPRPAVIDTVDLIGTVRRRQRDTGAAQRLPRDLGAARAALDLPPHRPHDAASDAVATAELLLALHTRLRG